MRSSGLYEKPEASITGPQKACSPIVCILITERIFNLKLEKIKLEIRNQKKSSSNKQPNKYVYLHFKLINKIIVLESVPRWSCHCDYIISNPEIRPIEKVAECFLQFLISISVFRSFRFYLPTWQWSIMAVILAI